MWLVAADVLCCVSVCLCVCLLIRAMSTAGRDAVWVVDLAGTKEPYTRCSDLPGKEQFWGDRKPSWLWSIGHIWHWAKLFGSWQQWCGLLLLVLQWLVVVISRSVLVYSEWFSEESDVIGHVVQSEHSTRWVIVVTWHCERLWLDAESRGWVAAANRLAAIRWSVYYTAREWTNTAAAG